MICCSGSKPVGGTTVRHEEWCIPSTCQPGQNTTRCSTITGINTRLFALIAWLYMQNTNPWFSFKKLLLNAFCQINGSVRLMKSVNVIPVSNQFNLKKRNRIWFKENVYLFWKEPTAPAANIKPLFQSQLSKVMVGIEIGS